MYLAIQVFRICPRVYSAVSVPDAESAANVPETESAASIPDTESAANVPELVSIPDLMPLVSLPDSRSLASLPGPRTPKTVPTILLSSSCQQQVNTVSGGFQCSDYLIRSQPAGASSGTFKRMCSSFLYLARVSGKTRLQFLSSSPMVSGRKGFQLLSSSPWVSGKTHLPPEALLHCQVVGLLCHQDVGLLCHYIVGLPCCQVLGVFCSTSPKVLRAALLGFLSTSQRVVYVSSFS